MFIAGIKVVHGVVGGVNRVVVGIGVVLGGLLGSLGLSTWVVWVIHGVV